MIRLMDPVASTKGVWGGWNGRTVGVTGKKLGVFMVFGLGYRGGDERLGRGCLFLIWGSFFGFL